LGDHEEQRWPSGWAHRIGQFADQRYRDIFVCELELICVLLCLRRVIVFCRGAVLRIHCDNMPCVQAGRKHSTRSPRMHPVLLEMELLCTVWDVELEWLHVRSYDNDLADLQSRKWDPGFVPAELEEALVALEASAARRFPVRPRRCRMARPQMLVMLQENTWQFDAWGGVMSEEERAEYDDLLPEYQRARGKKEADRVVGAQPRHAVMVEEPPAPDVRWIRAQAANRSWSGPRRSAVHVNRDEAARQRAGAAPERQKGR
jgi:hypothetical protein